MVSRDAARDAAHVPGAAMLVVGAFVRSAFDVARPGRGACLRWRAVGIVSALAGGRRQSGVGAARMRRWAEETFWAVQDEPQASEHEGRPAKAKSEGKGGAAPYFFSLGTHTSGQSWPTEPCLQARSRCCPGGQSGRVRFLTSF